MSWGVIGGMMLAASAYFLVIGISTESVPNKWPASAWTREQHPYAYKLFIWASVAVGGVGMLFLASSVR